jgi:hypothetical protein
VRACRDTRPRWLTLQTMIPPIVAHARANERQRPDRVERLKEAVVGEGVGTGRKTCLGRRELQGPGARAVRTCIGAHRAECRRQICAQLEDHGVVTSSWAHSLPSASRWRTRAFMPASTPAKG